MQHGLREDWECRAAQTLRCPDEVMSSHNSVYLRPRHLDDRRPFGQFRLDEFGGFLRRAARGGVDAGLLQALEHYRVGQTLVYGFAQRIDDRWWGVCRCKDGIPGVALKTLQSLLLQGWELR